MLLQPGAILIRIPIVIYKPASHFTSRSESRTDILQTFTYLTEHNQFRFYAEVSLPSFMQMAKE